MFVLQQYQHAREKVEVDLVLVLHVKVLQHALEVLAAGVQALFGHQSQQPVEVHHVALACHHAEAALQTLDFHQRE